MSAGRPTHTLTHAEFQHLLQRAAERDVHREPRLFTLGELVAAGQELGIDPVSVQEVYGEYQRHAVSAARRPVRQPPLGSPVQVIRRGDVLQLVVPEVRTRNHREALTILAMAAILPAVGFFSLDEIFVPLAGTVAMLAVAGVRWFWGPRYPGVELRLFCDGSGVLMELDGDRTTSHPLIAGQVHARLATDVETRDDKAYTVDYLALDHATVTHSLMAAYSHAERAWVVDEIESWLGR